MDTKATTWQALLQTNMQTPYRCHQGVSKTLDSEEKGYHLSTFFVLQLVTAVVATAAASTSSSTVYTATGYWGTPSSFHGHSPPRLSQYISLSPCSSTSLIVTCQINNYSVIMCVAQRVVGLFLHVMGTKCKWNVRDLELNFANPEV